MECNRCYIESVRYQAARLNVRHDNRADIEIVLASDYHWLETRSAHPSRCRPYSRTTAAVQMHQLIYFTP